MTGTNCSTTFLNVQDACAILNLQTAAVTVEDIKTAYHKAATKYHPDRNPAGLKMMQMVNAAYDVLKQQDVSKLANNQNCFDYGDAINTALNVIIDLSGLKIEVCGAWVWVGGDTKTNREALKQAGFFWAHKKTMWYFRPEKHKSRNHQAWSMDKIRTVYGQDPINSREQKRLQMYN